MVDSLLGDTVTGTGCLFDVVEPLCSTTLGKVLYYSVLTCLVGLHGGSEARG